jgi:hypothetical protein
LAKSVDDAAVIVIGPEPSKLTPLMARAVASADAVPALPLHVPAVEIVRADALLPITDIGCERDSGEVAVRDVVATVPCVSGHEPEDVQ